MKNYITYGIIAFLLMVLPKELVPFTLNSISTILYSSFLVFLICYLIEQVSQSSKIPLITLGTLGGILLIILIGLIIYSNIINANDSFGLGIMAYVVLTGIGIIFLSMILYIIFVRVSTGNSIIRNQILTVFLLLYVFTHYLHVPNDTFVPIQTYILSILVFGILLVILQYLVYRFSSIKSDHFLLIWLVVVLVITYSPFTVQLLLLYPVEIMLVINIVIYGLKEKDNLDLL